MVLDLQQEIVIVTVIGVESFPCSMRGQKKIMIDGKWQIGSLQLPWKLPMTWLEEQLTELVTGDLSNVTFKVADLINPDEPDQIVKVMIDCGKCPVVERDTLQKALIAAHDETPAALATIVKSMGSTLHKAGARMLIYRDGQTHGTFGSFSVESEIRLEALKVIDEERSCNHIVSLSADNVALEGMACDGMLEIFVEPVNTFMQALKHSDK